MSRKFCVFLVIAALPLLLFCCGKPQPAAGAPRKQSLHRADLMVAGSSCAACLIRLEKKLKAEKGVLKVVVSIYKPFKAVVIYDESETNWSTINKILAGEKVSATGFKDKPISDLPLVLEAK